MYRIVDIIKSSKFAIHDLSRSGIDSKTKLARFNMPLELGLFIGAKEFGCGEQGDKSYLVLDKDRYRYRNFISDLSGIDPKSHDGSYEKAIVAARDWLRNLPDIDYSIPTGKTIAARYAKFQEDMPAIALSLKLSSSKKIKIDELTYSDYVFLIQEWLKNNKP